MRKSCKLLIALSLTACAPTAQPAAPAATAGAFVLELAASTPPDPGPRARPPGATPAPGDPVATPGPGAAPSPVASSGSSSGGGGSSGGSPGGGPGMPEGAYFLVPGQAPVTATAGDEVALPAGLAGEVSLFAPGRVPSTLVLDGAGPTATHPRPESVAGTPGGPATLVGSLGAGTGPARVRFLAAERLAIVDAPAAPGGAFQLDLPLAGGQDGLVVALDAANPPNFGLARVAPTEGQRLDVGSLALLAPDAVQDLPPVPPGGLVADLNELVLADGAGAGRPLAVLASRDQPLVTYPVPGADWLLRYRAISPAGRRSSSTCGPAGAVPAFLEPPDLSGLPATLAAGSALRWPAVPGAKLYAVRLTRVDVPDPPLWEAASASPGLSLPAPLQLPATGLTLRVEAWDAQDVTLFTLASVRALKLPADDARAGRFSAAVRLY